MAYKLRPEDKEEMTRSNNIPFGVTPVQITLAEVGETDGGSEYIEIGVVDADSHEGTARLYFTEKAARYSVQAIRDIAVHNAKGEEQRESRRQIVDNIEDIDQLAELINEKMSAFDCWFIRQYDPKQTYTGRDGKTYRSVNTRVVGYEAKVDPANMPAPRDNRDQEQINPADFPDDDIVSQGTEVQLEVPFDSPGDAPGSKTNGIPEKSAW